MDPHQQAELLDTYRYLAAHPEIFVAIGNAEGDSLRIQQSLRQRFPADAVRLAISVAELRQRAKAKFVRAEVMWFDRVRLEQSTPEPVARYKARRFGGTIWDFCCGAGADAVALAARGEVQAVDSDPLACLLTELNAAALGVTVTTHCRPLEQITSRDGLLHLDPDRRPGGKGRSLRVEDSHPAPEAIRGLMSEFAGGAVKLGPASNFGGKFDGVETELISLNGECKEATLWFGSLAEPNLWRATLLPGGDTLAGDPLEAEPRQAPLEGYLYDPDPAVVRAGLIDLLCDRTGLSRLDPAEEYLTADAPVDTPFATGFRVLAELPNNLKALRKQLRDTAASQLEIKARRIPIDAEALQRSLPTLGDKPLVVLFARIGGKAKIVIAERLTNPAELLSGPAG